MNNRCPILETLYKIDYLQLDYTNKQNLFFKNVSMIDTTNKCILNQTINYDLKEPLFKQLVYLNITT